MLTVSKISEAFCLKIHNIFSACNGDSGGPLTLAINSEEILLEVVSYGYECLSNHSSVSSSIPEFRDWQATTNQPLSSKESDQY